MRNKLSDLVMRQCRAVRMALLGLVLAVQIPAVVRYLPALGTDRFFREVRRGVRCAVLEAWAG